VAILIPARFNGPADSANGGVTAGLLAGLLGGDDIEQRAVEVTLRRPPPLQIELRVERAEPATGPAEALRLFDEDRLIAEAVIVVDDDLAPVPPVSQVDAERAAARYDGLTDHPFPTCYVCGVERAGHDGLELFAGRVGTGPDDDRVATPWQVGRDLDLGAVLVWAALDCPGGWSIGLSGRRAVLGRIRARVSSLPQPDEACVVVGWRDGWQGRKALARTSAYGQDGRLLGVAAQTWIELR